MCTENSILVSKASVCRTSHSLVEGPGSLAALKPLSEVKPSSKYLDYLPSSK